MVRFAGRVWHVKSYSASEIRKHLKSHFCRVVSYALWIISLEMWKVYVEGCLHEDYTMRKRANVFPFYPQCLLLAVFAWVVAHKGSWLWSPVSGVFSGFHRSVWSSFPVYKHIPACLMPSPLHYAIQLFIVRDCFAGSYVFLKYCFTNLLLG